MTILFITAELINSATGYCAVTVAKELAERGHSVHIVSANRTEKSSIESNGHLYIHEIPGNRHKCYILKCLESDSRFSRLIGRVLVLKQNLLIQLKGLFTMIPLFSVEEVLYDKTLEIIERHKVDLIIPVNNPRESVIVANRLYHKYGIPYVPYFLDSIYGNIGLRILPKRLNKKRALLFEKKWLSDAKCIIMMQSVKELYDDVDSSQYKYVSKIVYLEIPLLVSREPRNGYKANPNCYNNGQFVILFVGTIPNRIREPRFVFRLAEQLAKGNVHCYFAGKTDYKNELDYLLAKNKNTHYLGQIDHDKIADYIEEADVLLNIGNSIPGMLPSKVFEYMSYKKPILSTIKHSFDKSVPYLTQYGASQIINEVDPIQDSLAIVEAFIKRVKNGEFSVDLNRLVTKNGPLFFNTPLCFSEQIESIMTVNN